MQSKQPQLRPAWRIEGRANPFVPWQMLGNFWRLEEACQKAPAIKKEGKFYAVRVRAN